MHEFTKTIIVDPDHAVVVGEYYQTIKDATQYFITYTIDGGTIIVEQDKYTIASSSDTVKVPSNVTIIGRGNAIIEVTGNVPAFVNYGQTLVEPEGNERIRIEGFKIAVKQSSGKYGNNTYSSVISVIDMKKVKHSTFSKLYITLDSSSTDGVDELGTAIYLEGERVTAA